MEPGQVLVALLYLWLLIALGVYLWRLYRRVVHGETRRDRAAGRDGTADPVGEPGDGTLARSTPAAGTAPGRQGVFAPTDPSVTSASPTGPTRPTVAELVVGIALPCGLVPVVTGAELDPHHVVFATTGHEVGEVGSALADELERLGFELRNESDTEAVAVRGDERLRVRVRRDGDEPGAPAPPPGPSGRRSGGVDDPVRVTAELTS